jgi:hypothetical protein
MRKDLGTETEYAVRIETLKQMGSLQQAWMFEEEDIKRVLWRFELNLVRRKGWTCGTRMTILSKNSRTFFIKRWVVRRSKVSKQDLLFVTSSILSISLFETCERRDHPDSISICQSRRLHFPSIRQILPRRLPRPTHYNPPKHPTNRPPPQQ